jgi:pSer/pThr/pTyr-binding forkhead associated (FHA) protein
MHLEFPKQSCVACIGEDIPEPFLNSLGIFMASGGPSNKKRMVVTQILETQQPNVYLIGDILSQVYLETHNFEGDPATFREIKHRGNIKAALRDGVLVAKVVAQRIAGKKEFDVELDFVEEGQKVEEKKPEAAALATIFAQALPGTKESGIQIKKAESRTYLVRMLPGGVQEDEFALKEFGVTTIGRKFCDIVFPDDELLSERHASVSHDKNGYSLRDDGSATGVFLRAPEGVPVEVGDGDLVRMGRQFILFGVKGGDCSFTHYDRNGQRVDWHPLSEKTLVIGREAPDITLDAGDMALSRRHLSVQVRDGRIVIKDLKSLNGTYLKVRDMVKLEPGAQFRVGRQSFALMTEQEKPAERLRVSTVPPTPVPPPKEAVPSGSEVSVNFKNAGKRFTSEKGKTICDIAEKNGLKIVAECHAGICGSDPIRILSGRQNLNPVTAEEKGTLEDICGLSPGECRLACMAKPTGPVEVDIIS